MPETSVHEDRPIAALQQQYRDGPEDHYDVVGNRTPRRWSSRRSWISGVVSARGMRFMNSLTAALDAGESAATVLRGHRQDCNHCLVEIQLWLSL